MPRCRLLQHDYLNRGKGVYEQERQRLRLPALVETGRCSAARPRCLPRGPQRGPPAYRLPGRLDCSQSWSNCG